MDSKRSDGTQGLPLDTARTLFHRIASAVDFCHQKGIYHRDLKPENVLVNLDDMSVRLADFGLATDKAWSRIQACGSVRYMSPECLGVDAIAAPQPQTPPPPPPKTQRLRLRPQRRLGPRHHPPQHVIRPTPLEFPADDTCLISYFSDYYNTPTPPTPTPSIDLRRTKTILHPPKRGHRRFLSNGGPITDAYTAATPTPPSLYPSSIFVTMFGVSPDFDATLRWCFHPDPSRRPTVQTLDTWVMALQTFQHPLWRVVPRTWEGEVEGGGRMAASPLPPSPASLRFEEEGRGGGGFHLLG
ncbi:kinase-like domain-containing protein [Chytridium lagenaria]|nr:kinase-like domain-containing protein [Chytridium lagenaria]